MPKIQSRNHLVITETVLKKTDIPHFDQQENAICLAGNNTDNNTCWTARLKKIATSTLCSWQNCGSDRWCPQLEDCRHDDSYSTPHRV